MTDHEPTVVESRSARDGNADTSVALGLEMLGVTLLNKCNIWCTYCYNAKSSDGAYALASFLQDKAHVSAARVIELIDEAISLGLRDVQISGGEPLIRYSDVLRIVRYCDSRDVICGIFTNAILARPARIRELKEAGLGWARISLGGANHEVHSRERGGSRSQFDKIIRHIRTFVEEGIPTGLFCPMVRSSDPDELVATALLAGELGVDHIIFDGYIPSGIPEQDDKGMMEIDQTYKCLASLLQARRRLADVVDVKFYYGAFEYVSPEWHEGEAVYECKNGISRLSVDADGGIRPSLSNSRVLGSIYDENFNLADLWTNHPGLRGIRNPEPAEPCKSCCRWSVCKGSDDSLTYNIRGGEAGPPPTCPAVREYALLIDEGLPGDEAAQRALRHNYSATEIG